MTRDKLAKTTLSQHDCVALWEKKVQSAAQAGEWMTEINVARESSMLKLFFAWIETCDFNFKNITLPQHHECIFKVCWLPPLSKEERKMLDNEVY